MIKTLNKGVNVLTEKLAKTIMDRLKEEYSKLESHEEKIQFALQYAGHYMLNDFIAYMEGIETKPDSSTERNADVSSHLYRLLNDTEYQEKVRENLDRVKLEYDQQFNSK
jgi:translation elongation factor EF-1beta